MKSFKILFFILFFVHLKMNAQYGFINQYSSLSGEAFKAYSCGQSADGNYLIAAYGYNPDALDSTLLILKIDNQGDTLWTRFYNISTAAEIPRHLLITADSGFVVTGDNFIMKADSMGNVEWLKIIYGKTGKWIEKIPEGFIFCLLDISLSSSDSYFLKTDPAGNYISSYKMTNGIHDGLHQITRLVSGDFAISATIYSHTTSRAVLFLADSNLNIKASLDLEGDVMHCIQSIDNDLILTYYNNYSLQGTGILKMDTMGNIKWHHALHPAYTPTGIDTLSNGGIIICGYVHYSVSPSNLFISKFDSTGTLFQTDLLCCHEGAPHLRTTSDGGFIAFINDTSAGSSMKVIKEAPPLSSGCFSSDSGFTSAPDQHPFLFVFSSGGINAFPIFLQDDTATVSSGCLEDKLCFTLEISDPAFMENGMLISPNPSTGNFKIHFYPSIKEVGSIIVYNQLGTVVYEQENIVLNDAAFSIDLIELPGIYFLKARTDNNIYSGKLLLVGTVN